MIPRYPKTILRRDYFDIQRQILVIRVGFAYILDGLIIVLSLGFLSPSYGIGALGRLMVDIKRGLKK